MDPEHSAGTDLAADLAGPPQPAGELVRLAATAMVGLLVMVAAVLCWRRAVGALSNPLQPAALVLVGASAAAAAAAVRMAWRYRAEEEHPGLAGRFRAAVLSGAVLAVGAVLSLPDTSQAGLAALWGILAVEECWAWAPVGWRRLAAGRRGGGTGMMPVARAPWHWRDASGTQGRQPLGVAPPRPSAPAPVPSSPVWDNPPAENVTQQLTRSSTADGSEVLRGWLRVAMAAGQRSASVHLAFCPPFARTPRVTVEQLEGPRARIKTVRRLPYGARFDLKLGSPSEAAATLLLQFSAEAAAPAGPSTEATSDGGKDASET